MVHYTLHLDTEGEESHYLLSGEAQIIYRENNFRIKLVPNIYK